MHESLNQKLQQVLDRHEELGALLADQSVLADQHQFRKLSKEYAQLEPLVNTYSQYQQLKADLETAREMQNEAEDDQTRQFAADEIVDLNKRLEAVAEKLEILLLPEDPNDDANVFLEIRAAAGGDEAGLFAGDLFRMYSRYAESKGWQMAIVNEHLAEHGGYKEIICKITGDGVYSRLKFESGAHRVQRVPATESQGRIHTSTCTVAVMPEAQKIDEVELSQNDLRIDSFRSSGSGGQHVNTTDSAIRITHLPSGLVVECQEQRSQHKNKAQALAVLKARLYQIEQQKQKQKEQKDRRNLVGSGDRSERVRTYNFPQGRVTDHRINLTLYKLDSIIEGHLDDIIATLIKEHQADLLKSITNET